MNDNNTKEIKVHFPGEEDIIALSDFFKVMGDGTRLKILIALINGEFCVSELADILNMSPQKCQADSLKTRWSYDLLCLR